MGMRREIPARAENTCCVLVQSRLKKNPRYIHISNMENQHVVGPKTLVQHAEGADLP